MNKVHYSSAKDDWQTPQWLFDALSEEFDFHVDVACNMHNSLCPIGYHVEVDNGLLRDWVPLRDKAYWMNPPYGRQIGKWVKKAYEESKKGCTVVCLLPARTDTKWFHEYCIKGEIRFIQGRITFVGAKSPAPFPSMIVVFK